VTPAPRTAVVLEEIRCPKCRKLLGKMEPHALRAGRLLEIKCGACNAFCTRIGDEADEPVS
jgi:phage FluMu protein Com